MTLIGWIWIIFTLIFIILSIFHFIKSGKKISKFQVRERPLSDIGTIKVLGSDVDEPLRSFANDLNSYIDSYNNSTSMQNRIAAFSYIIAAIIAFLSFLLELEIIK